MGIRLHVLAKELGTPSKQLVARCRERGIKVKSHLSSVPEPIAEVLRKEIVWRRERAKQEEAKAAEERELQKAQPPRAPAQPRGRTRGAVERGAGPARRPPPRGGRPAPAAAPPSQQPAEKASEARGGGRPRRGRRPQTGPAKEKHVSTLAKDHGRVKQGVAAVEGKVWRPPKKDPGDARRQRFRRRSKKGRAPEMPPPERPESAEVEVPVSIRDLSSAMAVKAADIVRDLLLNGMALSINDYIPEELLPQIGESFSVQINIKKAKTLEEEALEQLTVPDRPEDLVPRAPVVTFLGHVDHGKTSLLDRIRRTNVTEGEHGGITQHIGAYSVEVESKRVVFLDTPGHEAFTAMRARGANVTDVVVLVIAADDGVMPQTIEAINHARAAGVPIVVALNKIDKPNANPDRVKQQLSEHEMVPHDWGGNTEVVPVSAITGQGIDDLLEVLSLESDLLELKGNPSKSAAGTVLEAHLSEGKGVVATVLIQDGTLHRGDYVICGAATGKVRAVYDDQWRSVPAAGPATPVEISGLDIVPEAGDGLQGAPDAQRAKELANERMSRRREEGLARRQHVTLETLFTHLAQAKVKEAAVILKTDVKGSAEVISGALNNLSTDEVRVRILHAAVGGVSESDVLLADASDAVIMAFQVVPEERARLLAEEKGVEIRQYQVIYEAVDDVKLALEGLLEPEKKEETVGHMNVTNLFRSSKFGVILGGRVTDGRLARTDNARLIRDSRIVYDGRISSLRRDKDDVREVQTGFECGVRLVNFNDAKEGDVLETYIIKEIARKLS